MSSAATHPTKNRLIRRPLGVESRGWGGQGGVVQVVCWRGEESGGGGAGCGASKDVKMCRISCFSMQGTSQKIGIKLRSAPVFFSPPDTLQ